MSVEVVVSAILLKESNCSSNVKCTPRMGCTKVALTGSSVVRSLYIKIQEYQLHPSKDGLRYMRQLQLSQAAIDEHKLKSWRIEELKIDVCS